LRKLLFLGVPILGVMALLLGAANAGSISTAPGGRTLRTGATVTTLAADGTRAEVATGCGPHVFELVAWSPVRRSVVPIASRRERTCYGSSTGEGISALGAAGERLAWVQFAGGNYRQMWLLTGTVGSPRSTTRLTGERSHNTGSGEGDWVGNIHGDGSLLVFNTWSVCESLIEGGSCPEGTPPGLHILDENIWRIVGRRKRLVLASPDEASVLSVAAGRILVQRADGSLELLRADGSVLRTVPFRPKQVRGAVLDAYELVVLEKTRRLNWRVYDPVSGDQKRAFRAPAGARPADVERGLLVYVVGRVVHVLRLADGRHRGFTTPVGTEYPLAEIEPSGLFYSYQAGREGRVRFLPFDRIRFR
jgi:hypothetical protein